MRWNAIGLQCRACHAALDFGPELARNGARMPVTPAPQASLGRVRKRFSPQSSSILSQAKRLTKARGPVGSSSRLLRWLEFFSSSTYANRVSSVTENWGLWALDDVIVSIVGILRSPVETGEAAFHTDLNGCSSSCSSPKTTPLKVERLNCEYCERAGAAAGGRYDARPNSQF